MLKKINRALKRKDFNLLRDKGVVYQSPLFGLSVADTGGEELKFATIVSKKISKKAVDRNRIRRLLLESARVNLGVIKVKGIKAIFLAKRTIIGKGFDEVNNEVKKIFELIKTDEKNSTKGDQIL